MKNILLGECCETLKAFETDTFDSLVTDPPAGISFMGKDWDGDKGGREEWIAWAAEVFRECLRVMKPGAHGLVWALPRTSHWTATALELAGFEIRDRVSHLFGTGFPKSLDVSKAIDKAAGAEREVVGESPNWRPAKTHGGAGFDASVGSGTAVMKLTAPATADAKRWDGFGTALKPACEDWWLVRKPLSEKTVAANVLRWGTGALNIDASRIGTQPRPVMVRTQTVVGPNAMAGASTGATPSGALTSLGRFPSHLVLSHSPECREVGTKKVRGGHRGDAPKETAPTFGGMPTGATRDYTDADGTETVPAWECTEGCAVAELDRQSGVSKSQGGSRGGSRSLDFGMRAQDVKPGKGDAGGASRFFYCAKASRADRNRGLEGLPEQELRTLQDNGGNFKTGSGNARKATAQNIHPTVKSTALMAYLCRLVTPPGGHVLDPFAGSGSTGVAALREGFEFTGIEQNPVYAEIARSRIAECSPP